MAAGLEREGLTVTGGVSATNHARLSGLTRFIAQENIGVLGPSETGLLFAKTEGWPAVLRAATTPPNGARSRGRRSGGKPKYQTESAKPCRLRA